MAEKGNAQGRISGKAVTPREVCAVVVTYFPSGPFEDRLLEASRQTGGLVIVDNDSDESTRARLRAEARHRGWVFLELGENRGLGAALNAGMRRALEAGFRWALTLDQDSRPDEGMVPELCSTVNGWAGKERVALVGPDIMDLGTPGARYRWLCPHPAFPLLFRRRAVSGADLDEVTAVITSGALVSLEAWAAVGAFREDFFIDYVDTEFCLRAKSRGWRVLVSARARLLHRLGDRRYVSILGLCVRPTFHQPFRLYYIFRNKIAVVRLHARRFPHWLVFELCFSAFFLARMLLAEDRRREKLKAALLGLWDGLTGRPEPRLLPEPVARRTVS